MRVWVRSDLHISLYQLAHAYDDSPDHDVSVLAGDIAGGLVRQIEVIDSVASKPVILVAGNHEFWNRCLSDELAAAHEAARQSRWVHFLDASETVIGGVRFLGGTLWTDFNFFGSDARAHAMAHTQARNVDFSSIHVDAKMKKFFTPSDARERHLAMRRFLEDSFARAHDGPTVVVSHHVPSRQSIAPEWKQDPGTPAYVTKLDAEIERWRPALWVHGHVHDSWDYRIGETRVLCNPLGMRNENRVRFDPRLVVEV